MPKESAGQINYCDIWRIWYEEKPLLGARIVLCYGNRGHVVCKYDDRGQCTRPDDQPAGERVAADNSAATAAAEEVT